MAEQKQGWDEEELGLTPLLDAVGSAHPQTYEQCQRSYKLLSLLIFSSCSVPIPLSFITPVLTQVYRRDFSPPHVSIPAWRHSEMSLR